MKVPRILLLIAGFSALFGAVAVMGYLRFGGHGMATTTAQAQRVPEGARPVCYAGDAPEGGSSKVMSESAATTVTNYFTNVPAGTNSKVRFTTISERHIRGVLTLSNGFGTYNFSLDGEAGQAVATSAWDVTAIAACRM